MSTPILDVLCHLLSGLSADVLQKLDTTAWLELPKVEGMSVPQAVGTIRVYLQSITVLKKRLSCIARIYCRLIDLNVVRPWVLYGLDNKKLDGTTFKYFLDTKLRLPGHEMGYYCMLKGPYQYYCFVASDDGTGTNYRLSCFCVSSCSPCVAVYQAPGGQGVLSMFTLQVLEQMFGGTPDEFRRGFYPDPISAFDAAKQYYQ
ncbi:hypothetical protein MTO96_015774 [Rhipicephalus appendiculatus]